MKTRRLLNTIFQSFFILFSNTAGIWLTYFLVNFILVGIICNLKWPGFMSFVQNGSLLLITFSNLTTVIITTSANLKFNKYNIFAIILLVISQLIFARFVGLNGQQLDFYSGTIPFLLSCILLFFALKNQHNLFRKYSWLYQAKSNAYYYDIFLSFAIAGNANKKERDSVEYFVASLDSVFKECGYSNIFNASKYFNPCHEKQQPEDAATEDFAAIENSKNFILFYPEECPTSALIELGYALSDKRNILIISKNVHTLPFLARGMAEAHNNVRTIYYENNFTDCIENIRANHSKYFK